MDSSKSPRSGIKLLSPGRLRTILNDEKCHVEQLSFRQINDEPADQCVCLRVRLNFKRTNKRQRLKAKRTR